jgi:ornithine cyclodeaminase
MPVRILDRAQVTSLLPMEECIEAMVTALAALSQGAAQLPLRTVLRVGGDAGFFGVMPGELRDPPAVGAKIITVYHGNEGSVLDSHQGLVVLFNPVNGAPEAILDAISITAIRTAAVSGAATRAMARAEAGDLAILGSGVQARTHLEAMACARRLRRVRVWSRHPGSAKEFAAWAERALQQTVETMDTAARAVEGADLICTVTSSATPVLEGRWISPGAHLNVVGSSVARSREIDTDAMKRGRLIVDRVESAMKEAGDFLIPRTEGAIGDEHIKGELGDVFTGRVPGRTSPDEVTIFKSLGLAIEDLAAGDLVLRKANAAGVGMVVDLAARHPS